MAKYRVILFDLSTSTEYNRVVEAQDRDAALEKARSEILSFICEMEEITDPRLRDQILNDLVSRDDQVSLEL